MVNNFKMNILNGVFFPNYGISTLLWSHPKTDGTEKAVETTSAFSTQCYRR